MAVNDAASPLGRRDPAAVERAAVSRLICTLQERFPDLPPEVIADGVGRHHQRFEDSRVRDFVPMLVERAARAELKTAGHDHTE
jgi:hypothetical protein